MIILLILISLLALLWAANNLITGASALAAYYKLPSVWVGFTLVALSTSAPEIIIAITASLEGVPDLAIGNAIGTNIANIGLVLGLITLIKPLRVQSSLLRREYPLLFLIMLFSYVLMLDGYIGVLDGCLFLLVCLGLVSYLVIITRQQHHPQQLTLAFQKAMLGNESIRMHVINLVLGIIVLPISASYLITSCITFGRIAGISDLVMGLTILAIGTSLPELITSIIAIIKGADELAIGNILGANIFNLLTVMIFPSIISTATIHESLLWRDIPAMFLLTLVLLWINYRHQRQMSRWHGGILVLVYCCYMVALIINAVVRSH